MNKYINILQVIFSALVGFVFGGITHFEMCLLVLMVFDYITGCFSGYINKKISSKTGFYGIAKKIVIVFLIGVCHIVDVLLNLNFCKNIAVAFYSFNEIISIIENAAKIGVPFPKKVVDVLQQLKKGD